MEQAARCMGRLSLLISPRTATFGSPQTMSIRISSNGGQASSGFIKHIRARDSGEQRAMPSSSFGLASITTKSERRFKRIKSVQ
jgi:hypothetical protein